MIRVVVSITLALTASIAATEPNEIAVGIIEHLETPHDIPVTFIERRNNKMLAHPMELSGEILFSGSGTFSKNIHEPFRESIIISETHITLERGDETRKLSMQRRRGLEQFYRGLRALLNGDLITVLELFEVAATGGESEWTIELRPKDRQLKDFVQTISVHGTGSRVSLIRTVQSEHDWQELYLYPEGLE